MNDSCHTHTKYDMFLCHSSDDSRVVERLLRGLEGYRLPRGAAKGKRSLRGYHYAYDQKLGPSLRSELAQRLDESRHLVIASSPAAASSDLVLFEVQHFVQKNDPSRIYLAVAGGEGPERFPLEGIDDPIYVDVRVAACPAPLWWLWQKWRFRSKLLPLLACLFEVEPNDLVRRETRRRRLVQTWTTLVLLVVAVTGAISFARTPTEDWVGVVIESDSDALEIARLVETDDGRFIRAGYAVILRNSTEMDDYPLTYDEVNEIDLQGNLVGFYGVTIADDRVDFEATGTLSNDVERLGRVRLHHLLTSPRSWADIPESERNDHIQRITAAGLSAGRVHLFRLPDTNLMAIAETDDGAQLLWASSDEGSWESFGDVAQWSETSGEPFVSPENEGRVLAIGWRGKAPRGDRDGRPNVLFVWRNEARLLDVVELPSQGSAWNRLLKGVVVSEPGGAGLAIRLVPSHRLAKGPVKHSILFRPPEVGAGWKEIATNRWRDQDVKLVGATDDGVVVILIDGRISIWRPLSVLERIRRALP